MSAEENPFRRRWRSGRGLLAFVGVGAVSWPVVYEIAILVDPPFTPDGHPVMVIGQVAVATLAAPVLGAIAAYFAARPPTAR